MLTKILSLLFILTLLSCNQSPNEKLQHNIESLPLKTKQISDTLEVGYFKNDIPTITLDKKFILTTFNNNAITTANNKISAKDLNIKNVFIASKKYEYSDDVYYMLIGTNHEGSYKIAIDLVLKKNKFYGFFKSFITCAGCIEECNPSIYIDEEGGKHFYCDTDCPQNSPECIQTVSYYLND